MGGKKINRAGGPKHRAKRASIDSTNVVRSMDYGKRAPAPAPVPVPVPVPVPAPAPVQEPAAGNLLIPVPAPGALNPTAVAAVGKNPIRNKISDFDA